MRLEMGQRGKGERIVKALRQFHELQKARVRLNEEIAKLKEEILFFESMEENELCQK